jgi:uncharacterized protein
MIEIIIFVLSIIQSIFGIGLLAIGTPLLLLLNYDFFQILKILLPCSILISIFQIKKSKEITREEKKMIYLSLPFIFIGIFIIYYFKSQINFKLSIGIATILALVTKVFLKKKVSSLVHNNKKTMIYLTGFFHGLTNSGGSFVSLIFQILKKNKLKIRASISYAYFYFASTQYLSLNLFSKKIIFSSSDLIFLVLTCIGYFLGNAIFQKIKLNVFLNILNIIILFSALSLIISELNYLL